MNCPSCNAPVDDPGVNFCGRCGADLRIASPLPDALADRESPRPTPPGTPDAMLGRVVEGRYRVLERLGSGGMGVVYRVEHTAMGKVAAMKMLHASLTTDREIVKRFRREAEAVSMLTHPSAVQVFDFGEYEGSLYMVMEFVRGQDLAAILRRDGPLPWVRASGLLTQICDALADAHAAGIIHRDLKPENVLVSRTRDGREIAKVLDFGLAKLTQPRRPDGLDGALDGKGRAVTERGTVIGTPYYMSPEQIRAEEPDNRSDIYSFGALMYRVLTGEPPFTGPTPLVVLSKHLTEAPVPLAQKRPDLGFDERLETIVARCLAKDREARYPNIESVAAAIEDVRGPDATPVPRAIPGDRREEGANSGGMAAVDRLSREDFDRFEHGLRFRRRLALAALPLTLAALGAGGFYVWRAAQPRPVDVEVEPNDTAATANLIEAARTVRGHIGPANPGAPGGVDVDFYRFTVKQAPAVLHLDLTGIPGVDVKLAVFDATGAPLAETNAGGAGAGETIPNLRLPTKGDYFVDVRPQFVNQDVVSDTSDWYTLTATWRPLRSDEESEPDDTPADAIALRPDVPIKGYLGKIGDLDVYRPTGKAGGKLAGTVTGIDGVDLRVVVVPPMTTLAVPLDKTPGAKVFDAGGAGEPEKFADMPWPAGAPAPLVVVQRKDPPVGKDKKPPPAVGFDSQYSITIVRAP